MMLLITGASGFLGQYVVAEALRRGHQVRAVVRPAADEASIPWHTHPNVELVRLDLRQRQGLVEALQGVNTVIHLAAAKSGDFYTQFAGTVVATENLLNAMTEANVLRLVAISTFSVYDYLHIRAGQMIDEESPIDRTPIHRDEYAQTKLIQEQLVRDFERDQNGQVTILRPGMIYGRDNLWNAYIGAELAGDLWLRIGLHAQIPLNYVENCAEAILLAVERDEAIGKTLNIVDDDLPNQKEYASKLKQHTSEHPRLIPVNWTVMRLAVDALWLYNKLLLKGQMKPPGIFVPARLHPRFKPFRYGNARIKQVLGWTPKYSLDEAIDRSCSEDNLLDVPHAAYASSVQSP
jgi:nucleoside-diphosphate-sugar epimerase